MALYQMEPRLFNPEWRPILDPTEVAVLLRPGGEKTVVVVDAVQYIGFIPVDFAPFGAGGSILNGATLPPTRAQGAGGNPADIFLLGPDEFLQIRFRLDTRDWLDYPTVASPNVPAQILIYEPGSSDVLWATQAQLGVWDVNQQAYWTSLQQTQHFSYYNETPLYSIINNSGATLTNARVRFEAFRYIGRRIQDSAGTSGEMSFNNDVLKAIQQSPTSRAIWIPTSPQNTRRTTANL